MSNGVANILRQGPASEILIYTLFQAVRVLNASEVEHLLVGGVAAEFWGRQRQPTVGYELHHFYSTDTDALNARKDIDLLVHDINKANTALRSARFHVSGRGLKRKAWIKTGPEQRVVKLDLHQDAALVVSRHAEETVERIHIATPILLLTMTLQGLGTVSRSGKVDPDIRSTRWLVQIRYQRNASFGRYLQN